jgi:hypothetical protein
MMLLGMKKKLEDDTMGEGMKKLAEEMKKLEDDNIPEDTKMDCKLSLMVAVVM